jgi:hypothetical protein
MSGGVSEYKKVKGMQIEVGEHRLDVEQKIAGGAYGDIWKCREVGTGIIYAAKEIKTQSE